MPLPVRFSVPEFHIKIIFRTEMAASLFEMLQQAEKIAGGQKRFVLGWRPAKAPGGGIFVPSY
jgi:hypothetical protein